MLVGPACLPAGMDVFEQEVPRFSYPILSASVDGSRSRVRTLCTRRRHPQVFAWRVGAGVVLWSRAPELSCGECTVCAWTTAESLFRSQLCDCSMPLSWLGGFKSAVFVAAATPNSTPTNAAHTTVACTPHPLVLTFYWNFFPFCFPLAHHPPTHHAHLLVLPADIFVVHASCPEYGGDASQQGPPAAAGRVAGAEQGRRPGGDGWGRVWQY